MAELVLGPLLRYVGETEASIWVETDGPCEVEALGSTARTFHVEGHHYALVLVEGLEPDAAYEYTVALDGEQKWPESGSAFPPSFVRTLGSGPPTKLVFGSCRVAAPHTPPFSLKKDSDESGRELDALYALALRMRQEEAGSWPHLLLLLGDQVYADEPSPAMREYLRSRRADHTVPGDQVANFEEYTELYRDSWSDPVIRWLLSTVSTSMVFDDHDVHDDWNISEAWVKKMRAKPWWHERIVGAFVSYWIYQHLGNLSSREIAEDGLLERVAEADDAGPLLRQFAMRADGQAEGVRWSFHRDLNGTRLVVIDSRAGRVVEGDRREMVDDREWEWIERHAEGNFDHLLLASSVPFLMGHGMHHGEAWNEAICAGAWGARAAKLGEKVRQALDLEHWPAFGSSFKKLVELLRTVGAGERGRPPASVVGLSGDVHHAYLAEVGFRRQAKVRSAVYQVVCSPFRNPLGKRERRIMRAGASRPVGAVTRALARAAGVEKPDVRWRLTEDPSFDNQVGTLEIKGRQATVRIEKTVPGDSEEPRLEPVFERRLA